MRSDSVALEMDGGALLDSVRFIHARSVSGVQPILLATDVIAAQRELWSCSVVRTSLTARSRVSGEYPGFFFIG